MKVFGFLRKRDTTQQAKYFARAAYGAMDAARMVCKYAGVPDEHWEQMRDYAMGRATELTDEEVTKFMMGIVAMGEDDD
jgi:hypothetical protein